MKQWLLSYVVISRKERLGAVVMALLIAGIWILPRYFRKAQPAQELIQRANDVLAEKSNTADTRTKPLRFVYFDPNSADDNTFLDMGLTEKNVQTIRRFQAKGGYFRNGEDLKKIYGIRPDVINRLVPYARVAKNRKQDPGVRVATQVSATEAKYQRYPLYEKRKPQVVDLAIADTASLIALPGIGPTLARRIIQFRDKCGGFYAVDQVAEVYGLQDSVFRKIKPLLKLETVQTRKLALNQLSMDSLAAHPYISYAEARAIVKYREQHGPFRRAEELLDIALLTQDWLRKLEPYLLIN